MDLKLAAASFLAVVVAAGAPAAVFLEVEESVVVVESSAVWVGTACAVAAQALLNLEQKCAYEVATVVWSEYMSE